MLKFNPCTARGQERENRSRHSEKERKRQTEKHAETKVVAFSIDTSLFILIFSLSQLICITKPRAGPKIRSVYDFDFYLLRQFMYIKVMRGLDYYIPSTLIS